MTRSFDRRGGYPGGYPAGGTVNVNRPMPTASASIRPKKEEPVSLDLDCMCKNNDPNCTECWIVPKLVPFPGLELLRDDLKASAV